MNLLEIAANEVATKEELAEQPNTGFDMHGNVTFDE